MKQHPSVRHDKPFAELQRIEADPEFRSAFLAELNAAIDRRNAERAAVSESWCVAVDRLRGLVGTGTGMGTDAGTGMGTGGDRAA